MEIQLGEGKFLSTAVPFYVLSYIQTEGGLRLRDRNVWADEKPIVPSAA